MVSTSGAVPRQSDRWTKESLPSCGGLPAGTVHALVAAERVLLQEQLHRCRQTVGAGAEIEPGGGQLGPAPGRRCSEAGNNVAEKRRVDARHGAQHGIADLDQYDTGKAQGS